MSDNNMQDTLPKTMKAGIATGTGEVDKNIQLSVDWPTPCLPDDGDGHIIIRVLACALAPGDVRLMTGYTDYMQLPPGGRPYVVGSDVSGIVLQVSPEEKKFKVGDYVVSRFDEPQPNGGVAEYRLVKTCLSEVCPAAISPTVACGLPASAMAAKRITRTFCCAGDRVLVIGGSGAVGSSVIQYCKMLGAETVVAVSTQEDLCRRLGADRVIDYRTTKWWNCEEFHGKDAGFDVIFDLVNGENWTQGVSARAGKTAIQSKGKYVALLTGVDTDFKAYGAWTAFKLVVVEIMGRLLRSRLHPRLPRLELPEALKLEEGDLKDLFQDVVEGKLKPLVDPSSPFDFTEEGIRSAFHLQKSKHAHGKVVISIAET